MRLLPTAVDGFPQCVGQIPEMLRIVSMFRDICWNDFADSSPGLSLLL